MSSPSPCAELRALDPAVPLYDVRSLEQHLGLAAAQERMAARLAAGFSLLALLLSAVGLYGLLAYYVALRRRKIGVRIALGAHRGDVLKHVLARGTAGSSSGPADTRCRRLIS